MSHWWRAHDEAIDDPKLCLLSDRAHRAWFHLCCLTSANGGTLPAEKVILLKLRLTRARLGAVLAELKEAGLIDEDEEGMRPHNWNGRQFKSDAPKEPRGKDSYVYVIGHAWGAEALKIGFSKNPWARIGELQTAHHEKLSVLAVFRCQSNSEVDLHDILKPYRKSGEWFSLPVKVYVAISNASDRSCSYDDLVVELRDLLRSATTETDSRNRKKEESEDAADAASTKGKKYEFEHGIIRLTTKDFSKWEKAFSYLDLRAELIALTQWAAEQGPDNWFFAVSGALAKRNRDQKFRLEQAKQGGAARPLTPAGNPWPEGIT